MAIEPVIIPVVTFLTPLELVLVSVSFILSEKIVFIQRKFKIFGFKYKIGNRRVYFVRLRFYKKTMKLRNLEKPNISI